MEEKSITARKKGRLNILDIIIIVMVALIVGVCIILSINAFNIDAIGSEQRKISYTIVFEDFESDKYDIAVDGNVVDAATGRIVGKVTLTNNDDDYAYDYVLQSNGEGGYMAVREPDHSRINKSITVTADAAYKEGIGYTVNGVRIAIGKSSEYRFADYSGIGYCNGISVIQ